MNPTIGQDDQNCGPDVLFTFKTAKPADFSFGALNSDDRLETLAIEFVVISQEIGQGNWVPISFQDYKQLFPTESAPEAASTETPNAKRALFLELVMRGVLASENGRYTAGPRLGWFLGKYNTRFSARAA